MLSKKEKTKKFVSSCTRWLFEDQFFSIIMAKKLLVRSRIKSKKRLSLFYGARWC